MFLQYLMKLNYNSIKVLLKNIIICTNKIIYKMLIVYILCTFWPIQWGLFYLIKNWIQVHFVKSVYLKL